MFFILNLLIFYQIQIDEGQTLFTAVPKVNKITKELSLCNIFKISNRYIFLNHSRRPEIFQTVNSV